MIFRMKKATKLHKLIYPLDLVCTKGNFILQEGWQNLRVECYHCLQFVILKCLQPSLLQIYKSLQCLLVWTTGILLYFEQQGYSYTLHSRYALILCTARYCYILYSRDALICCRAGILLYFVEQVTLKCCTAILFTASYS